METVTIKGAGTKEIYLPTGDYTVEETAWGASASTTVKVDEAGAVEAKTAEFTVSAKNTEITFTNTYTASTPTDPTEPGGSGGGEGEDPPTVPPLGGGDDHTSYIEGYPDGTVRPEGPITRAEVASILFRLLTDSARSAYKTTENPFPDVQEGAWYNLAVSTLQKMGILHGYEDGTFRPDRPITRAEMAVIVAQFYDTGGSTGNKHYYEDVEADSWYSFFVEFVTEKGIMVGVGGGSFEPDRTLTRAEAMAVFNRLLGRKPDKESFTPVERADRDYVTWPDNSKAAWYYADVQEATNSHEYHMSGEHEVWTDALGMKHWEG